jgi:hypothetical protein
LRSQCGGKGSDHQLERSVKPNEFNELGYWRLESKFLCCRRTPEKYDNQRHDEAEHDTRERGQRIVLLCGHDQVSHEAT